MANLSRRRFIQLVAACSATTAMPLTAKALLAAKPQMVTWQGQALGAEATLSLAHENHAFAQKVIQDCLREINRLESIFSLYREDSQISKLNHHKQLVHPAPELVEVIESAIQFGEQSDGLFDVTIQPLWQLYHQHFLKEGADPVGPPAEEIHRMLVSVDYRQIDVSAREISLKPDMAMTLNGIAQGYITDRIAAKLKQHGFENALINLGEYRAIGSHPHARPWKVGIAEPSHPWKIAKQMDVPAGKALASSGGYGTQWSDKAHHLLSPKTGYPVKAAKGLVTVIADTAMEADALATIESLSA